MPEFFVIKLQKFLETSFYRTSLSNCFSTFDESYTTCSGGISPVFNFYGQKCISINEVSQEILIANITFIETLETSLG